MDRSSTILLIDDDRVWLDTLADYLGGHGLRVQTAQEGDRGLRLIQQFNVPLAVVDFNMPGMNGLELLRRVRGLQRHVGVLLLSSEEDPTLPARALAEGARAFLSKNTPPGQLLEILRQTLEAYGFGSIPADYARLLPVLLPHRRTLPVPFVVHRRPPLLGS